MTLEEILGSNSSNITIKNAKPKVDVGAVMSQYNTYQADAINSPYNKEWKGFIAIENGIKSGLKGLVDVVRMGRDLHIQSALERDPNYQVNEFARSLDDVSDSDMLKTEAVASTSGVGQLGLDVAQGFGQMAPALVASAAGSPVAGAAVMGASIAGETYDSLRDEGVDVTTAATASSINTAIQTPLEMIGLGKMFKALPVGSSLSYAARELAERVVSEGVTEFVQEYPDAITRIWAKNADKDASEIAGIVADNIGDITSDAVYSGLIGSILGGGLGGANISMQMALGDSFQRAAERGVHESKLGILERQIGNFAEQGTDADVAGAVVDASSNDARVYVDGEALTAYAQSSAELNKLALSLGVDVEAIKKAADNGSSVAISLGGFEATALKHENFFQEVKDNLSFEDGGITNANEKLRQMQAEVKKAEADKAIALEESTALALQEEQDAVLSSMLTAGVPRSQANLVMELLTARAKVMNPENPAQFLKDYALKYQQGGATGALKQSMFEISKSGATRLKHLRDRIADRKSKGLPPNKLQFTDSESGITYYEERVAHGKNDHDLTDEDYENIEQGFRKGMYNVYTSNWGREYGGLVSIISKIENNGKFYVVVAEFMRNGGVIYKTAFPMANENAADSFIKIKGARMLSTDESAAVSTGHPLDVSSIQKILGIVKKGNYDQVGATPEETEAVRQQYEGTEQWMKAPNGEPTNLTERQWLLVRTPSFKEWFGDWENDPENASKVVNENGEPLVVYHGTTGGEFDTFDRRFGSIEGDMGAGFYFTSDYDDVKANYEDGGSDFENKVARLAEQIEADEEIDYEEAEQKAREQLYVGGFMFETFLNIKKPANVADTTLFEEDSVEIEELDEEDYEDEDEFYEAQNQARETAWAEIIDNAVYNATRNFDIDESALSGLLWDAIGNGGISIADLKEQINEQYFEDENGNLAGNEILRLVLEGLGYDGIIDSTVSEKFNMDMNDDTTHYIAFEPNQIKSATGNNGNFDASDANIYHQMAGEKAINAPLVKLNESKALEAAGTTPEDIFKQTGWLKGVDGKWRFEIPDNITKIDLGAFPKNKGAAITLGALYDNPQLYEAYPHLSGINVVWRDLAANHETARTLLNTENVFESVIELNINAEVEGAIKGAIIHEIQHIIQEAEGFASGGSSATIRKRISRELDRLELDAKTVEKVNPKAKELVMLWSNLAEGDIAENIKKEEELASDEKTFEAAKELDTLYQRIDELKRALGKDDYRIYHNLAGEQEARATAKRALDMKLYYEDRDDVQKAFIEAMGTYRDAVMEADEETRKLAEEWIATTIKSYQLEYDEARAAGLNEKIEKVRGINEKLADAMEEVDWQYGSLVEADKEIKEKFTSTTPVVHGLDAVVVFGDTEFAASSTTVGAEVKGSFNPTRQEGQYVISLFKGADASTVIHETGHYFVETMWQAIMDGQASQQVEKDFDTLLEYAGMTREQWAAADISGRRKAHEHLAEAFESYIMEGKAPNEQLRNAFRRFADWLKSVYKAIRRNSNSLPLTDEVRGVFDRMLAAEEDIQQEKRLNGYFEHLPKVITDSMSDATKVRVEAFIDKARDKAVELLTKDAMSIYKEDQKEAIKDYRAEIIPEVEKEVGELRVYKSGYTHADVKKYENLWAIVTGTDEVGRELTPEEEAWMMQADLMAESLGYSSTDEMLQDVMKAPTFKQAVTKRVSERVNEKFLDVMTDIRAHEEAVRRAIYNDDAGLLIGVEQQLIEEYAEKAMDAQSEKEATAKAKAEAGEQADDNKPAPSLQSKSKEQMRERAAAYRQQARNVARADIARMTIAEAVKVQKFAALERKAAMKSAAAMAKKDYREALTQKNLQAYYHAMVQESMLTKRHVEKNKAFLRRMVKAKPEAWTSEKHFAEISMLFMRMGIAGKKHDTTGRVGVSLAEYAELMNEQYDCAEFADWLLELPDSAMLTNAKEMTLGQFEDVVNAVRNIKAIARAEKGEAMFNKGEAFAELKGTIIENLSGLKTVFTPDPNHPTRAKLLDKMTASMETIDTFFQRLDGWKDGFFVNTFLARIKRSNDMEFDFKERFDNAVLAASKRWLPDKKAEAAAAQEKYYDELGTSVSKHILVKMLMNLGNKENTERLCETRPIGFEKSALWVMADESGLSRDEAVDATRTNLLEFLQNNLTAEDVRYAQDMVNAAGMFWAEKNNMEIRIKGFGMKKVEAEPAVLKINGKDVVFMGGYFPLMRNGELGSHPVSKEVGEDDPLQGRNIRTLHTNSGATKHRTRARYPVNLFPGAEMQVLYDSIHDLCWRETMNDFRRILNDSELFAMFKSKLGPARMRLFREMLEKAAQPYNSTSADLAEQTFGTALTWLRNKSANAVIMMNIKINLQNLGNIFLYGNAVEDFGYKDTISALGNYMINFSSADGYRSMTEFISSKSSFMRERMTIPDITVRDIQADEQIKQSELEQKIMRIGSMMMAFTDGLTAKPVWMQAYSNAVSNGKTEQEAIDYADMIIRRTIGSARMTDVSSLQRGGPIFKLLTMFQSFFNAQYNQWVREYGHDRMLIKQGKKGEAYERMFAFVMAKFLMMSIASLTLALENPFGDKDEDDWPDLLHEMKNYGFGLLGPAGQVGSVFVGKMLGMQEFDYRMSVVQSTLEKGFKVAGTINKAATGKAEVAEGVEAVTDVAGLAVGIPQQANRLLWNLYDILFNDMSPELSDLTRRRPKADR